MERGNLKLKEKLTNEKELLDLITEKEIQIKKCIKKISSLNKEIKKIKYDLRLLRSTIEATNNKTTEENNLELEENKEIETKEIETKEIETLVLGDAVEDTDKVIDNTIIEECNNEVVEDSILEKTNDQVVDNSIIEEKNKEVSEDSISEEINKEVINDSIIEKVNNEISEDNIGEEINKEVVNDNIIEESNDEVSQASIIEESTKELENNIINENSKEEVVELVLNDETIVEENNTNTENLNNNDSIKLIEKLKMSFIENKNFECINILNNIIKHIKDIESSIKDEDKIVILFLSYFYNKLDSLIEKSSIIRNYFLNNSIEMKLLKMMMEEGELPLYTGLQICVKTLIKNEKTLFNSLDAILRGKIIERINNISYRTFEEVDSIKDIVYGDNVLNIKAWIREKDGITMRLVEGLYSSSKEKIYMLESAAYVLRLNFRKSEEN